jgi:hypothetical protein
LLFELTFACLKMLGKVLSAILLVFLKFKVLAVAEFKNFHSLFFRRQILKKIGLAVLQALMVK